MLTQKWNRAFVHAEPFPNSIAEDKPAVEHRYGRFLTRNELAVNINQYRTIALVRAVRVGAVDHKK